MDYIDDIDAAKEMIDESGATMSLVTMIPGTYTATSDTLSSTLTTYPIIAVMTSPKRQTESGEWGRSNRTRLLIAAKGLPSNLNELNFKVLKGTKIWNPEVTTVVKPGGQPILFIVDMKIVEV